MAGWITAIFSSPQMKKQGVNLAQFGAQKKQDEAITKREKTEKSQLTARRRILASRQRRRASLGTLFQETGELGVTLGGPGK
mgnify:CR=1 FL=1